MERAHLSCTPILHTHLAQVVAVWGVKPEVYLCSLSHPWSAGFNFQTVFCKKCRLEAGFLKYFHFLSCSRGSSRGSLGPVPALPAGLGAAGSAARAGREPRPGFSSAAPSGSLLPRPLEVLNLKIQNPLFYLKLREDDPVLCCVPGPRGGWEEKRCGGNMLGHVGRWTSQATSPSI